MNALSTQTLPLLFSAAGASYLLSCNVAGIALAISVNSATLSSGALLRLVPPWMPVDRVPFACLGIYFCLFQLTAAIGRLATSTYIGGHCPHRSRVIKMYSKGWIAISTMLAISTNANSKRGYPGYRTFSG